LFAIEYKESPDLTIYILSSLTLSPGIINCCPIDKLLLDKLFVDLSSLTVIPYLLAISYNVSPLLTM